MELLLNLFWLTLAVPALWMWCRKSVYAKDRGSFDGIRPVLLLGCALMLLFPVVSATDDLHAMRQDTADIAQHDAFLWIGDPRSRMWTRVSSLASPDTLAALIRRMEEE